MGPVRRTPGEAAVRVLVPAPPGPRARPAHRRAHHPQRARRRWSMSEPRCPWSPSSSRRGTRRHPSSAASSTSWLRTSPRSPRGGGRRRRLRRRHRADRARSILAEAGLARWVVHRNPGGSTPSNLNAGLALVRAPSSVGSTLAASSRRTTSAGAPRSSDGEPMSPWSADAQVAVARSDSGRDLGIARALNNRYGMGLSRYRRGASERARRHRVPRRVPHRGAASMRADGTSDSPRTRTST